MSAELQAEIKRLQDIVDVNDERLATLNDEKNAVIAQIQAQLEKERADYRILRTDYDEDTLECEQRVHAWRKDASSMMKERDEAQSEVARLSCEIKELQEAHARSHEVAADLRDEVALLRDLLEQVFTEATRTTHSIPDALVSAVVARLNIKPSEAE